MSARRMVFVDIETGGLELTHPITQIAAVAVDLDGWKEVATFMRRVQFDEAKATSEALSLNHYDATAWAKDARPEVEVCAAMGRFLDYHKTIGKVSAQGKPYIVARLAAHNAAFDAPRIEAMFKRNQVFLPADRLTLCTLQRACWLISEYGMSPPPNYRLESLLDYFGIKRDKDKAHDALEDARGAAALAKAIYEAERGADGSA